MKPWIVRTVALSIQSMPIFDVSMKWNGTGGIVSVSGQMQANVLFWQGERVC
jgi:hypothetical protein